VLIPLSVVVALVLVALGIPQTLSGSVEASCAAIRQFL
jgi:K+-transporting ATPase A subunit